MIKPQKKISLWEGFVALWVSLALVAMLAVIPAIGMSVFLDNPNTVKHSVDATLIDAHTFSKSTGKYSSELRWEGRFRLEDGRTIDQEIDGFFFKSFMKGGEQPIKSWIAVSGRQLWKPDPAWVAWRDGFFLSSFLGLIGLFAGMLLCLTINPRD